MENHYEELKQKRLEKIRVSRRKRERRHYGKYAERYRIKSSDYLQKRRLLIKKILGNSCAVCGSENNLIIHHVNYGKSKTYPTFEDLKAGRLVLVCGSHHRAIHYISRLRDKGLLEKVMALLNPVPRFALLKSK